jgi:uncharacterized protein YjcR
MNKNIDKDFMDKLFLNTKELSIRWGISVHTLKQWRSLDKGPQYSKISGHASYKIKDVEEFEKEAEHIGRDKKTNKSENE